MCRRLHSQVVGMEICHSPRIPIETTGRLLARSDLESMHGAVIEDVKRHGKYIIFSTRAGTLVSHCAMSGFWDTDLEPWTFDYVEGRRTVDTQHVRCRIPTVEIGRTRRGPVLRYHDVRKFGRLDFCPIDVDGFVLAKRMGPEALVTERAATVTQFVGRSLGSDFRPIKQVLTDQSVVAGVGNIYSTEALWRASVWPWMPSAALSIGETMELMVCLQEVLEEALHHEVRYDRFLRVYRQRSCVRCGTTIARESLAKRATYYCPRCQRAPF